jgi:transcriptional regulator with XRE-family HTH domain
MFMWSLHSAMGVARAIIARNLRMMRNALGYTQVDLAGVSEIDRSYISGVEREKRSISADKVEQLAKVFGVHIFEMFHPDTGETYQQTHKDNPRAKAKALARERRARSKDRAQQAAAPTR